jgi:phosphonopyruvate decarboxylase
MIDANTFINAAAVRGFDFYSGVPCSFLTPLINRVASNRHITYVGATSEGEAIAIAAGAWLGGRRTVVMCQNSGLGNAVNPLTSLNWPFRIPTLLIVTWRGQPGTKDEPQHALMGPILPRLLSVIQVAHGRFPCEASEIVPALDMAEASISESDLPFAFLMEQNSVRSNGLDEPARLPLPPGARIDLSSGGVRPARADLLERFLAAVPADTAVIATTGKCGRELFTLADRPQHFYQVGSMGCASGMGLGVALATRRRVAVLDGDGAVLMKLGSLATIGAYRPGNLTHILYDNGVHDSTGGQATVAPVIDFAGVALACGYRGAWVCDSAEGFESALAKALAAEGPVLVHARIRPGSMVMLGRPTVPPYEVARRFKAFLAQPAEALASGTDLVNSATAAIA